jgi:hypothetical protein
MESEKSEVRSVKGKAAWLWSLTLHFSLLTSHFSLSAGDFPSEDVQQARLIAFPPTEDAAAPDPGLPDRDFLLRIAADTWKYFRDVVDRETGLPLDNVVLGQGQSKVNSFTSTTNIGLYIMCVVSAVDLGLIDQAEALRRIRLTLATLRRLESWEGQFFNYYETISLDASGGTVSSVDNGWLAAGLVVARQAFPAELEAEIDPLLDQLDFGKLYDPAQGLLFLNYDARTSKHSDNHYGMFCTEPRLTSYLAIAKGDVPREHWWRMHRTLPAEWEWQQKRPWGEWREADGVKYFAGHYRKCFLKYVPSWGGSLFEFLMPTLVLDEQRLAPEGLGLNNRRVVEAHIDYARNLKRYPAWGISPCSTPEDTMGYKEYGVKYLGAKGYEDEGVVTPHVTFLALAVDPAEAVRNLRELLRFPGVYGHYGFHDSVNVLNGAVSPRFLCLDQGMSLVALNNHLNDGAIRRRFHSWPEAQKQEDLLTREKFF